MSRTYEPDRIQCQAISPKTKKRCTLIATHSDGGKVLCERHLQIARRDRANNIPVERKEKK